MIGSPDMAFPRPNNIPFRSSPPSILLPTTPALVEPGTGTGWTVYPPLSAIPAHSGGSADPAIPSPHPSGVPPIPGALNSITSAPIDWCAGGCGVPVVSGPWGYSARLVLLGCFRVLKATCSAMPQPKAGTNRRPGRLRIRREFPWSVCLTGRTDTAADRVMDRSARPGWRHRPAAQPAGHGPRGWARRSPCHGSRVPIEPGRSGDWEWTAAPIGSGSVVRRQGRRWVVRLCLSSSRLRQALPSPVGR